MKLQMDFAAQTGKHFGVIQPLRDRILALASPIDVWLPELTTDNFTLVDGRISEWKGQRNGRVLGQANAARRPLPEANLLRFSSEAQAPMAQLDLTGAAIGAKTALTIAFHGRIHPEQLAVDNQYFLGTSVLGAMERVAYRFTSGNRYIRFQTGDNTTNLDLPLPLDWSGIIGGVLRLSGTTLQMHLTNGNNGQLTMPYAFNLSTFSVANAIAAAAGSLRGYIKCLGIWDRAVTDAERALLLRWVA